MMWNCVLLIVCICCCFNVGAAINCYVCDATDPNSLFQCSEWFERYDEPTIEPQNCSNVHDAQFCIKHIGRFEGGVGAKRFCSSKDLGNYCNYVQNKGDSMEYRSCIFTCNTDGCNGSTHVFGSKLLLGTTLALIAVTTFVKHFI